METAVMSEHSYNDPPRRPLWPMLVAFGSVGVIVLGCGGVLFIASGAGGSRPTGQNAVGSPGAPKAAAPMHSDGWLSKEEEAVKAFILDNANDPKSVEFSRWGPNVSGEAYLALMEESFDNDFQKRQRRQQPEYEKAMQRYEQEAAERPDDKHIRPMPPDPPPSKDILKKIGGLPLQGGTLVRVRYRAGNGATGKRLFDQVFLVSAGKRALVPVAGSDDWFESLRVKVSKETQ